MPRIRSSLRRLTLAFIACAPNEEAEDFSALTEVQPPTFLNAASPNTPARTSP